MTEDLTPDGTPHGSGAALRPDHALPPASAPLRPDHALPPGAATSPLEQGRQRIADVLERVGQDGGAEYLRGLNVEGVQEKIGRGVAEVEEHVRTRPLRTVAIAVVAGFVLGRMFRD